MRPKAPPSPPEGGDVTSPQPPPKEGESPPPSPRQRGRGCTHSLNVVVEGMWRLPSLPPLGGMRGASHLLCHIFNTIFFG